MDIFKSKPFSRAILLNLPVKDLFVAREKSPLWNEILEKHTFWLQKSKIVGMCQVKVEKWKKIFEDVKFDPHLHSLALQMLMKALDVDENEEDPSFDTPLYSIMMLSELKDILHFLKYFTQFDMIDEFKPVPKFVDDWAMGFIYSFWLFPPSKEHLKFEYYVQFKDDGSHSICLKSRYVHHPEGREHLIGETVLVQVVEDVSDYVNMSI